MAAPNNYAGGGNNAVACDGDDRGDDGQFSLAFRQQRQQEKPGRGNGDNGGGGENTIRIPASKIISLLRAGAIDEYRRSSPSLSAACIYREFAEGLGAAATKRKHDTRREHLGSTEHGDRPANDRGTNQGAGPRQDGVDGSDANDNERGWGVSKEEFCDYFEAVTDLVDLNGLSLVPQVHQRHAVPA